MERARTLFTGGLIALQARDETEKQYELAHNRQQSATANLGRAFPIMSYGLAARIAFSPRISYTAQLRCKQQF